MENMLNHQTNISFNGAGALHQNVAAECTTKIVVTTASNMLMHDALICTNDTFSIDFGQWKWTMMYGSKVGFLICSMIYKILRKFEPYMFWIQCLRRLE